MSTLRDDYPRCPCGEAMDTVREDRRYTCGTCKSILASEPEVMAVLAAIVRDPPATLPLDPPAQPTEPIRTCPRCQEAMTKHSMCGIQLDRCEAHGLWFEGGELQRVLEQVVIDHREKLPLSQKLVMAGSGVLLIASYIASFLIGGR